MKVVDGVLGACANDIDSHDCPVVGEEKIKEVEGLVKDEGVELGEEAWVGGRVVLVETWRPIGEWVVVAEREL